MKPMKKIIRIRDLFQVYLLWNSHYYIELLRPIDERDFTILSTTSNSIRFLSDCDWSYEYKESRHSFRDMTYIAKYTIVFNYKEELNDCLTSNLPNINNKMLKNMLDTLYSFYTTTLHINYSYVDYDIQESRNRDNEKTLKELKELVKSDVGIQKVATLYSSTIEKLNQQLEYYNTDYYDRVRYAVRDNKGYQDSIRRKYSDESKRLVDEIENKREKIKQLENEIEELSVVVVEEHKKLMKESVVSMGDIPQKVKDTILVDMDSYWGA